MTVFWLFTRLTDRGDLRDYFAHRYVYRRQFLLNRVGKSDPALVEPNAALAWLMEQEITHVYRWRTEGVRPKTCHALVEVPRIKDAVLFRLMFPQFPVEDAAP